MAHSMLRFIGIQNSNEEGGGGAVGRLLGVKQEVSASSLLCFQSGKIAQNTSQEILKKFKV